MSSIPMNRRKLLASAAGLALATPMIAPRSAWADDVEMEQDVTAAGSEFSRRNVSSFTTARWQDHFDQLGVGCIVCDTVSRALHYWSGDGQTYKLYPTSVPRTDELTRTGYTEIVRKKVGPTWTPTASMHERFPNYPQMIEANDPLNPLGTHAMYMGWPAYLIHGTHDTRKIGRRSSDGCIGLYNEKIAELFSLTEIGTQVRVI